MIIFSTGPLIVVVVVGGSGGGGGGSGGGGGGGGGGGVDVRGGGCMCRKFIKYEYHW